MTIQQWSDVILVVELDDEQSISEEFQTLCERLDSHHPAHVVLNMKTISKVNSSNISQLLRVRQKLISLDRRLKLCNVPDGVWSVMLVTGLDKIFEYAPDVSEALADLQLGE